MIEKEKEKKKPKDVDYAKVDIIPKLKKKMVYKILTG